MWARLKPWLERYESFLRIDASLSAEVRTRSRIIYLTGWLFLGLQILNMGSMLLIYGGWDRQHNIAVGACIVFLLVTHLLRFTKSPWVFGTIYAALPLGAIYMSAMAGSSLTVAQGVDTALLPLLAAAMAFLAYIGNRATSIGYTVAGVVMIYILHRASAAGITDPATQIILYQRALQGAMALILVAIVTATVSHLIYKNLNALEDAVARAKAAEAARADLMNTMSHEIRTPLNGIIAMSDMLSRSELDPDSKASARLIEKSADTLLGLLNEALDRAKGEAVGDADITVAAEPFDPAALMEECCSLFGAASTDKGLWIGTAGTEALPATLVGDAPHLRQVFSNLLGNAVKFTQAGGVRLGAKLGEARDGCTDILFYVQDTGAGIAPEDQARVLERFEQSGSAQTTEAKGTGLGLSICRDLVAAMGGELQLRSEVGRGSLFHFTLRLPVGGTAAKAA